MTFAADELEEGACAATGLEDFGSPYYREGLERIVEALNTEADLNEMGRVIQHATISNALIQRLKAAMSEHAKDESRCQNVSTQSYNGGEEELYKRVTVQARLKCDLEPLAAILYDLENGKPYLFIDQVMIYKQQTYTPPGAKVARIIASPLPGSKAAARARSDERRSIFASPGRDRA